MKRPELTNRIAELRTQIADDLVALRKGVPQRLAGPSALGDLGQTAGRLAGRYPAWAMAALAGALAGMLVAVRRRRGG